MLKRKCRTGWEVSVVSELVETEELDSVRFSKCDGKLASNSRNSYFSKYDSMS